ncbi:helix-turn-helix transcriptional regulator [Dokdonella soli]|uniref:helix-turn-helix domain-containing protein n=1 Tax=Dokdonella soli TaxID=529810 RepID=UPI0031E40BB0
MPKTIYREEHRLLSELLRELREQAGLTQADLSPLLGRPQNRISDFERGGRRVDVIEFLDFCEAVGADPLEVLRRLRQRLRQRGETPHQSKRGSKRS